MHQFYFIVVICRAKYLVIYLLVRRLEAVVRNSMVFSPKHPKQSCPLAPCWLRRPNRKSGIAPTSTCSHRCSHLHSTRVGQPSSVQGSARKDQRQAAPWHS